MISQIVKNADYQSTIQTMFRMLRLCPDDSGNVQNVQTFQTMLIMFRLCSDNAQNVQTMFKQRSECSYFADNVQIIFRQCSECSESVHTFLGMLRLFR